MNKHTVEFTDEELKVVRRAMEQLNDFTNDCLFDDFESFNFFPRDGRNSILYEDGADAVRKELYATFERYHAIRSVLTKLGIEVNANGYVV